MVSASDFSLFIRFISLIFCLPFFVSCAGLDVLEQPRVALADFKILSATPQRIQARLLLEVENPNPVSVTLSHGHGVVDDGHATVTFDYPADFPLIPGYGQRSIEWPVHWVPPPINKVPKNEMVTITGHVALIGPWSGKKLRFNRTLKMHLPHLPVVTHLEREFGEPNLCHMTLEIWNPNLFPIRMETVAGKIKIHERYYSLFVHQVQPTVQPQSRGTIVLEGRLDENQPANTSFPWNVIGEMSFSSPYGTIIIPLAPIVKKKNDSSKKN